MRAAITLLLVGMASLAHASAGTVTLLGVSGNGGPRFADELEVALSELYLVVPGDVYRSTASRLGRLSAAPQDVREVATAIRIDAIIAGAIVGERATRRLQIVVREGLSGVVISRRRYELASRTLPMLREIVVRDLVASLERVRRIPKRGQPVVEAPPSQDLVAHEEPEDRVAEASLVSRAAKPAPSSWRGGGVYAGVGPAIMSRSLAFDVPAAAGYHGGAVAGLRADGAIFPIALSTELAEAHPVLASFGVVGSYERAFALQSTTVLGATSGGASRFGVAFVGRAPLGARGGVLTIETGYEQVRWVSASQTDLGVPDVGYGLFAFGLTYEHDLGTQVVVLSLRLAGLGLVDPGAISDGTQYGPTKGGGLDADVGLTVRPKTWLWLRATVRATPLFLGFAAAGSRYANAATDRFIDATAEVGFAL